MAADPKEALRIHMEMYEGHIEDDEEEIERLNTTKAEGKRERQKLRERQQIAHYKLEALRWYGRDAGLLPKRTPIDKPAAIK